MLAAVRVLCGALIVQLLLSAAASAQEAHRRFDDQCLMRQQKFERILPQVMRENHVDMWIVAEREGHYDPMVDQLGEGYADEIGYYIFTDRPTVVASTSSARPSTSWTPVRSVRRTTSR